MFFMIFLGNKKLKVNTNAMVSNWMWFFRRSDVYDRNAWSNYTNWPSAIFPYDLVAAPMNLHIIRWFICNSRFRTYWSW